MCTVTGAMLYSRGATVGRAGAVDLVIRCCCCCWRRHLDVLARATTSVVWSLSSPCLSSVPRACTPTSTILLLLLVVAVFFGGRRQVRTQGHRQRCDRPPPALYVVIAHAKQHIRTPAPKRNLPPLSASCCRAAAAASCWWPIFFYLLLHVRRV